MKYIAVCDVEGFVNFGDAFDFNQNSVQEFDRQAAALEWIRQDAAEKGHNVEDYSIYIRHKVRQTLVMEA